MKQKILKLLLMPLLALGIGIQTPLIPDWIASGAVNSR